MKFKVIYIIILFFTIQYCYPQSWKKYPYTPQGSLISFPKDEGRHINEPVEWWYTSGHLVGENTGKKYSYMLTYFYYPQAGFQGFRILNISDDNTKQFYNDTKLVNYSILTTDKLHIQANKLGGGTEKWLNKLDVDENIIPFEYTISANSSNRALNLEYKTLKKPLIIANDGLFDQGASSYTYYYSQTKNEVTGTITLNGISETVTGNAWIDRQYGTFDPYTKEKYEWLSVQLSNGMDLNLWNIFTNSNTIPNELEYKILAAYVDENTQYTTKDFQLERLAFECIPDEMQCYAQQWKLTSSVKNIDLIISTLYVDAEMTFPFRFYEGATTIAGTVNGLSVTGVGFAELLQAYEKPDITITNPKNGSWTTSEPISWKVNNPNEGMPITYDLEYSIDNKSTFTPLAQGLIESSYLWDNPPLKNNDHIWFKVRGSSIDKTLQGEITNNSSNNVTLSNSDQFDKKSVKIYPNPTNKTLNIDLNKRFSTINYQVIDISGRILQEKEIKNNDSFYISVNLLQPGVYFLKLKAEDKKLISKFIIN